MEQFQKQASEILESIPPLTDPVTGIQEHDYWTAINTVKSVAAEADPGDATYWNNVANEIQNQWFNKPLRSKRNY